MRTQRTGEGYLLIDHRASPGTGKVPEGTIFEAPTFTCGHCGGVVVMNPARRRERAFCSRCACTLCDGCGAVRHLTLACEPAAAKLDLMIQQPLGGVTHG